ncbi:MAG TPA: ABC transporter permease [Gemmatimonadaceae bacterium]|nr:ABC transporter permease [Gemmatimonadaceae bacterium]
MSSFVHDLRYAVRTLTSAKSFVVLAVLCLGLGVGATTTIFNAVNAFLLRPLPFRDEERVVAVYETKPAQGVRDGPMSLGNYADWRHEARTLTGLSLYSDANFSVGGAAAAGGDDRPELVKGASVTADLFAMLGVSPTLGRAFRAEEERPGNGDVVILSDRLWRRHFGADPAIVGRTVVVGNRPRTVIGVMPPGWNFPDTHDLWLPQSVAPTEADRAGHNFSAVARLATGVTLAQAEAELRGIAAHLAREHPATNAGWSARITPFRARLVGEIRPALLIFLGVVFFVLFIACANVANLQLARAAARRKEIAVRAALGASRVRIIRQLLTESLLLGLGGGALGVLLSLWGIDAIVAAIPFELPFWMHFSVDWRVVAFAVAVSAASSAAFGVAPALQLSRPDLHETLKDTGRGAGGAGRRAGRLRGALVVTEVALSLVLLIGATLMMRSFVELRSADPGFDTSRLLTMRITFAGDAYKTPAQRAAQVARVLDRVRALPGVEAATTTNYVPLEGSNTETRFTVDGYTLAQGEELHASYRAVSEDYLRALRVPLVAGRFFTAAEAADTTSGAVVVNEVIARRFWPAGDAIGHRIRIADDAQWLTVVGVAPEIRQFKLDEGPRPQLYVPYSLAAWRTTTLVARTGGDPARAAPAVRDAVRAVDSSVPIGETMTMEQLVRRSVWQPRLYGSMFSAFALAAFLLAAAGIYGVVAYGVSQRTHEIGVRMALGAATRDVVSLVVGQGARLAALGVVLGVLGAVGLAHLLDALLYGVAPTDPFTFVVVPVALGATALLASWLPARRAARVDPMVALRAE